MRSDPGCDEARVLETVSPEDVLAGTQAHRHSCLIRELAVRIRHGDIRRRSDDLPVPVETGKKGGGKHQGAARSAIQLGDLDLPVAPAGDLDGDSAAKRNRRWIGDRDSDNPK